MSESEDTSGRGDKFTGENQDLLKPLENAISPLLIVAITERNCNQPD